MTVTQVQSASDSTFVPTTANAVFSTPATAGNLLLCVAGGRGDGTTPTGFTTIHNDLVTLANTTLSYKIAVGGETTFTCGFVTFQYKGIAVVELHSDLGWGTLDQEAHSDSVATAGTRTCPTVAPGVYPALDVGAVAIDVFDSLAPGPGPSCGWDAGYTFTGIANDNNVVGLGWREIVSGNAGGNTVTTGTARDMCIVTATYGIGGGWSIGTIRGN